MIVVSQSERITVIGMKSSRVNIDMSFFGILTIVFIVLKLCNVIDWSWWWVLAPTWIPISLLGLFVLGYVIYKKVSRRKY